MGQSLIRCAYRREDLQQRLRKGKSLSQQGLRWPLREGLPSNLGSGVRYRREDLPERLRKGKSLWQQGLRWRLQGGLPSKLRSGVRYRREDLHQRLRKEKSMSQQGLPWCLQGVLEQLTWRQQHLHRLPLVAMSPVSSV